MIFVETCHQKLKKLDFNQFGTVLVKMSLKIYLDENSQKNVELLDPVDFLIRMLNEFIFSAREVQDYNNTEN